MVLHLAALQGPPQGPGSSPSAQAPFCFCRCYLPIGVLDQDVESGLWSLMALVSDPSDEPAGRQRRVSV